MISKLTQKLFSTPLKRFYGTTPQMMHDLSADFLLDESARTRKRTKTICTIGYMIFNIDLKLKNQKWLFN